MGRTSRNYPKGKLKLRTPKELQSGKRYPVYIEYNWQADSMRKTTEVSVFPKDWNAKGFGGIGEIRATTDLEYKYYNTLLHKRLADIDAKIVQYYEKNGHVTGDVIRAFLEDNYELLRPDSGKDFVEFAKGLVKNRHDKGKIGVSAYKNAAAYLNKFSEFLLLTGKGTHGADNELIYVGEINENLVCDFRAWRLKAKRKPSAINKGLTTIFQTCEEAARLGYLSKEVNASIQGLYLKEEDILETEDRNIRYLKKEELEILADKYKTITQPRRKEFLEMFLFSFHACGLRLVDVMTLRWKDIDFKKKEIRKVQVKTRNRNTIPLSEPVSRILDKWRGRNKVYVFDLLSENFDLGDSEALYMRRNSWNNTINTALKAISKDLGWNINLTFHVARHTWAVLALASGADISEISRLLGHTSTGVTEKVYAEFLPETLSSVVDKLGFNFLPDIGKR
ncbi:MAG: tyrosine-type recombinase/integrase [Aeriscardovia sp.]|nr:tyrosine-type recombinase/integrase [Aeriscardovia sp.]